MKKKIRYHAKTDLKVLRQLNGMSKEYVADKIGYTTRSLERMEEENAVTTEETAYKLCELYDIEYQEQFYVVEQRKEEYIKEILQKIGRIPANDIYPKSKYYLLYIRKIDMFKDCVAGKGIWIANYNRNKEVRRLREVDVYKALELNPDIIIINNKDEWQHWYYGLNIGKMYKVIISENCMNECMKNCLKERIVRRDELMYYDGTSDIMFLGV